MCDALPGCRCATETRGAAVIALDAYRSRHPAGPAVDPLSAARSAPRAGVVRLASAWRTHEAALDASNDLATSLQNVGADLVERRREAWGTQDPAVLAKIEADQADVDRQLDATTVGLAALQAQADDAGRAGDRALATQLKARLVDAQARVARLAPADDLPATDQVIPVGGGAGMEEDTYDRWRAVGMAAQPRIADRTYRVVLVDVDDRAERARIDLPAHLVEVDRRPHKGMIVRTLEVAAARGDRQAQSVIAACAVSPPRRAGVHA